MFHFLKKKSVVEVEMKAIANGNVISIEKVPDEMFAQKLLGDGIGFVYEGDKIYAPCNGEIMMVAATSHAFGIKAENGAELLLHVGLDTVNLNGKGLTAKVKQGDKVQAGQLLLEIDRAFMNEEGIELTTPLILTSTEGYLLEKCNVDCNVTKDDTVFVLKKF